MAFMMGTGTAVEHAAVFTIGVASWLIRNQVLDIIAGIVGFALGKTLMDMGLYSLLVQTLGTYMGGSVVLSEPTAVLFALPSQLVSTVTIYFVVIGLPLVVIRRAFRKRLRMVFGRGRCLACGHPLPAANGDILFCTECGWDASKMYWGRRLTAKSDWLSVMSVLIIMIVWTAAIVLI